MHDHYEKHEQTYLQQATTDMRIVKSKIPWLNILFSIPIWGNLFAFFSHDFLLYTVLTTLPKYLNNVHNFDVSNSAMLSSLPYICNWIVIIMQTQLATFLQRKFILKI